MKQLEKIKLNTGRKETSLIATGCPSRYDGKNSPTNNLGSCIMSCSQCWNQEVEE